MGYNLRFSIGDIVYRTYNSMVIAAKVSSIRIDKKGTWYQIRHGGNYYQMKEENLFADRDEAEKSLIIKELS